MTFKWGLFLLESLVIISLVVGDGEKVCAKLNEKCTQTEDCCFGDCIADTCSDGLYKNNRDKAGTPPEQLIASEMTTGKNVDVSEHPNINLIASLDECGESHSARRRRKRIVGGTSYELGKYPWAVALHINQISESLSVFHCGGSLISRKYVITAAHCLTRLEAGQMLKYVTLGNVDRRAKLNCENATSESCKAQEYVDIEIDNWVVHEAYSEAHVRNDIALIRLKEEANYTDYIKPICLPRSEMIFKNWEDGEMTVIGWGSQNDPDGMAHIAWECSAKISLVAQEVEHWLVHRSNCDRFFTRSIGLLKKSQVRFKLPKPCNSSFSICVGGYPGKGDCTGDSGGSLFKRLPIDKEESYEEEESSEERYFLFGLVSTGAAVNCAREGRPSVYTHVMYYMPWVLDNLVLNKKNDTAKQMHIDVQKRVAIPKKEFATGFYPPMDITRHRNIGMLPQIPNCGIIHGQQDHAFSPGHSSSMKPARKKRVVGGIIQSIGTFPWLAQIYTRHVVTNEPDFRCGGFLITPRHVVTGAHCVADIRGPYALDGVILGNFNRKELVECIGSDCTNQKVVPIEEIFVHEAFTKFAKENDVAIVKLAHDVQFNRFIQPICLPLTEDIIGKAWPDPSNDLKYVAAGWGRVTTDSVETDDDGENVLSNLLVGANFVLQSKKYCDTVLLRKSGKLEKSRVCGGGNMPGRGECDGDTGGPMMRWVNSKGPNGQNETRMFAFGLLSVVECAAQGIPSLYQNLLYYMPWIMDHLDA